MITRQKPRSDEPRRCASTSYVAGTMWSCSAVDSAHKLERTVTARTVADRERIEAEIISALAATVGFVLLAVAAALDRFADSATSAATRLGTLSAASIGFLLVGGVIVARVQLRRGRRHSSLRREDWWRAALGWPIRGPVGMVTVSIISSTAAGLAIVVWGLGGFDDTVRYALAVLAVLVANLIVRVLWLRSTS